MPLVGITTSDNEVPQNSVKRPLRSAVSIFRHSDVNGLVNEFVIIIALLGGTHGQNVR